MEPVISRLHLRHLTDMDVRISAFWQSMMHFPDFHRKQGCLSVKRSRKAEMVTDADIIFWAPVRLRRHLVSKHIWKKMRWKEP